jgi:hypothetical protein
MMERECDRRPEYSRLIRDSESRLVELITGKGLEGHDTRTETMGIIVGRIAATPLNHRTCPRNFHFVQLLLQDGNQKSGDADYAAYYDADPLG